MKKRFLILIFIVGFLNLGLSVSNSAIEKTNSSNEQDEKNEVNDSYCIGEVIKIVGTREDVLPGGNKQITQDLLLKILTGADAGKIRITTNEIPDNPAFAIYGSVGKRYLIDKTENLSTGNEDYFIIDYYRQNYISWLIAIFLILIILVGGMKGIRTIISLLGTISLISFVLIPLIEKGVNPLLCAVGISFFAAAITMLLVAGLNVKSIISTLGTVFGVFISGVIATFVIHNAPLSGLSSSEAMILWGNQFYEINFKGLLAAAMIISCLGAVMDVAISISSSMYEIKIANPSYDIKKLFFSGMNIGRDIMGTMTNTLVLAYTGMALPLLLLISKDQNFEKYLNLEIVVSEITAAISGSIGLICCIPVTAILMALVLSKQKKI